MNIYVGILSVLIIMTVLISTQPSFGGKLESFIGNGEFVTAMCGTDETKGDLFNLDLDVNEKVQINCGREQVAEADVDTNVTINDGDSIKITCVPPVKSGEVVVPLALNSIQKVLCTTSAITE
ncbi:MAG: hypothetical protein ACE5SW_08855 [Nitrososphaeraceae archaeon]